MTQVTGTVREHAKVVAVTGALLGAAAAFASHGISFNQNRIIEGEPTSLVNGLGVWGWILVGAWVVAGLVSLSPLPDRIRGIVVTVLGGAAPVLMLWGAGIAASAHVAAASDVARTSLLWAAWLSLFASYVVIFAATAWLEAGSLRAVLTYLPVAGVIGLALTGQLSELAVAREYANNAESFAVELRLHLAYVGGAVSIGLISGLILGLIAVRRRSLEPAIFGTLNVLQVFPTLAFIGLMNPILTGASERIPLLEALGVRGVGWAPVIIVLSAYAVYPIARNTYTSLSSLDSDVLDAARGVGMSRTRMLAEIEFPLALPVIIAGLRVALVQTTAGAIVAGLIGGGGLGTFVFLGAGETATDLILLGVIPIMVLALFFDRSVLALQRALQPWDTTR
ncbi:MAG: ABC transporter permease [Coriobacteriia bacterium]|nr:ABC transporter permease [Coriobacteriia bacterium]